MPEWLRNIRVGMTSIFKRMFVIAMYLGVLLSLFAIHRYLLLGDGSLASHIGFSFLNAWALAKVILVGQELQIGDNFRNRTLVYVIGLKSAIFAVLLFVFRIIEEAVIGAVEGKGVYEAVFSGHPGLEHNKFQGMALTCIIMFFALMPFFAYLEFERVLGVKRMRSLMFGPAEAIDGQQGEAMIETESAAALPYAGSVSIPAADPEGGARAGSTIAAADHSAAQGELYQDVWFYDQAGEVMGPVDERELMRLLRVGVIGPQTLVHNVSINPQWLRLSETVLI